MNMDKKSLGLIAAAMLAALTGGAEVLSMGERVAALEALHPELITEVAAEVAAEVAEESTDPAPGEEALKLNEDDEWVPAEPEEVAAEPAEE